MNSSRGYKILNAKTINGDYARMIGLIAPDGMLLDLQRMVPGKENVRKAAAHFHEIATNDVPLWIQREVLRKSERRGE